MQTPHAPAHQRKQQYKSTRRKPMGTKHIGICQQETAKGTRQQK
jgi:hypothetical protein